MYILKFSDILDKVDEEDAKILKYLIASGIQTKSKLLYHRSEFASIINGYISVISELLDTFVIATLNPNDKLLKCQKYFKETPVNQIIGDIISDNDIIPTFTQWTTQMLHELYKSTEEVDEFVIDRRLKIKQFKNYAQYLSKLDEIEKKYNFEFI